MTEFTAVAWHARSLSRTSHCTGPFVTNLPDDWTFSAFTIGRDQLTYVAAAALVGGNVRVGLEDNLYLSRGRLASNRELVARAVTILEAMNIEVLGPQAVRDELELIGP